MEEYIRYGLLLLAAFILGFIIIEAWWRHRRFSSSLTDKMPMEEIYSNAKEPTLISKSEQEVKPTSTSSNSSKVSKLSNDYLAISVFAKNQKFESYELLQAIAATGMQFGEMNIFHYYLPSDSGKQTLFSLASATKPGYFELDKIGDLVCAGLTLFMDLRQSSNPGLAFNKMLKTAEQLAEDLDGVLRSDPYTDWTNELCDEYKKQIQQCCLA